MKLGTMLLRDAVISLNQLELGLRTQVLYGGKLGTNLVELGFLDLDALARYLADLCGLPAATQEMFEAAPRAVADELGADRAQTYGAFPLAFAGDDSLAVAFVEPPTPAVLDRLAKDCGRSVVPYIAPELRIYYYQEKVYGIARKARYVRPGNRARASSEPGERRRTQPARGLETPPEVRLEPRRKPTAPSARRTSGGGVGRADSADPAAHALRAAGELAAAGEPTDPGDGALSSVADAVKALVAKTSAGHAPPAAPPRAAPPAVYAPARVEPPMSLTRARDILATTDHRDHIGDTVVAFAQGRFDLAVVFLLRDSNALGWRLYTASGRPSEQAIQELSLPLGGASVLQAAFDTGAPFRGGPQSVGRPVEKRLWDALESAPPREMQVVPIKVRQRVVNLVYVHGLGGGAIHEQFAHDLERLAQSASDAYTRLIQHAKRSVLSTRVQ